MIEQTNEIQNVTMTSGINRNPFGIAFVILGVIYFKILKCTMYI